MNECADPRTDRVLTWLVRSACFVPIPSAEGEPVELCRWWTGGVADRLIIRGEDDAELLRIAEVDPREPANGRLVRRHRLPVVEIGDVVRDWGRPTWTSSPVRMKWPSRSSMDRGPLVGSTASVVALAGEGCS